MGYRVSHIFWRYQFLKTPTSRTTDLQQHTAAFCKFLPRLLRAARAGGVTEVPGFVSSCTGGAGRPGSAPLPAPLYRKKYPPLRGPGRVLAAAGAGQPGQPPRWNKPAPEGTRGRAAAPRLRPRRARLRLPHVTQRRPARATVGARWRQPSRVTARRRTW